VREAHIRVARTARYYTLGHDVAATRELWIVCHGYAQLARYFLRAFGTIDDGSRRIVAPEALNRYYFETRPGSHTRYARVAATWMTREDREHEIADYIDYLDALADHVQEEAARAGPRAADGLAGTGRDDASPAASAAERPSIVALGFSQGAATVSRWAARGRTRIDHVVLWGASLARELEPSAALFRGASLTIAIGNRDEHVSEERVAHEDRRLRDAGVDYRLLRYDGGHGIEAAALLEVAERLRTSAG
jgi:dienelactone hydrolase